MGKFKKIIQILVNPGCIRGVGLFFDNSKAMHWHRHIALNHYQHKSRTTWYFLLLTIIISWYLCLFWFEFFIFLKQRKKIQRTLNNHFDKSPETRKSLFSLSYDALYAGLWLGISPYNFFCTPLIKHPKNQWKNFIFLEERSTWYTHHNRKASTDKDFQHDINNLSNKQLFYTLLLSKNLPSVKTICEIPPELTTKNNELSEVLFNNKSIFAKPSFGHSMQGCCAIVYDNQTKNYTIDGYDLNNKWTKASSKKNIITFFKAQFYEKNKLTYLLQPLLINSKKLYEITHSKTLSTIRIITINRNNSPLVIAAMLEVNQSYKNEEPLWKTYLINILTGKFQIDKSLEKNVPLWSKIVKTCQLSHQLFPTIHSIAWDVGITDEGVKIIEGNFGWDVISLQSISKSDDLLQQLHKS